MRFGLSSGTEEKQFPFVITQSMGGDEARLFLHYLGHRMNQSIRVKMRVIEAES